MSETKTFDAVYIGLRRGENTPLVASWIALDAEGKLTERRLSFSTKGKKTILSGKAFIGDVYCIEEQENSCMPKGDRRQHQDGQARAEWRLEEANCKTSVAIDKGAAKENYGTLTLDDVRNQYRKQIGRDRRNAFLACVLQHITG